MSKFSQKNAVGAIFSKNIQFRRKLRFGRLAAAASGKKMQNLS